MTGCKSNGSDLENRIDIYPSFQSDYIDSRQIEVLLPDNYNDSVAYDVLYMHDGQNVFNEKTSYSGVAWSVEKAMDTLLKENKIREAIIVAIWNSPLRTQEYMPAKPLEKIVAAAREEGWQGIILSDEYLKFIVHELKPFVDSTYNTRTQRENTFVMGSSMGGLISFYAMAEYPEIFGGAACISTHWPALDGISLEYVEKNIPTPQNHKIYFDYGTLGLDAQYEPYQLKVDSMMNARGYEKGKNWMTLKFEDADHSEASWAKRVHLPLEFLLGKE